MLLWKIDSIVADGAQSLIREQVEMGVAPSSWMDVHVGQRRPGGRVRQLEAGLLGGLTDGAAGQGLVLLEVRLLEP